MRGLAVVLLVGACALSPQSEVQDVAQAYCRCYEPGQQSCVDMVTQEIGNSVSPECSQCVFDDQRTCAAMISDCTSLCFRIVTPPGGP
jgi:hypothetical protein